jgi:hypothetical protein
MRVQKLGLAHAVFTAWCVTVGGLQLVTAPALAALPDGRVYEVVSPAATEGSANIYVPIAGSDWTDRNSFKGGIVTRRPFEVAPDGEALVYAGDPPATGGGTGSSGQSNGDEFIATRSPQGGWNQVDLQPAGPFQAVYQAFSSDLSIGILNSDAPLQTGASPDALYSRAISGGGYEALFSGPQSIEYAGGNAGAGGVPAMTDLLFQSEEALLDGEGRLERELGEDVKLRKEEGKAVRVLYGSFNGQLSLVSVLPDGTPDVNATFGGPGDDAQHVIPADGSRVFWTALSDEQGPESLYVTTPSNGATIQIDVAAGGSSGSSGGGRFWMASSDGSKVFFTDESRLTGGSTAVVGAPELYEYDVESAQLKDITVDGRAGEQADVLGVAGSSEDGSYIYFVAAGVLAGNENEHQEKAVETQPNMYVYHEGTTMFVATLSEGDDNEVVPFDGEAEGNSSGDWQGDIKERTAEVTPDGRSLLFMSKKSLTGYDSTGLDEVFLYEAGSHELSCVSCSPNGEAPVGTELEVLLGTVGGVGAFFPITGRSVLGDTTQPSVISGDGGRVFFDSAQPLLAQDTNGFLDVYEWERNGSGDCRKTQGCVYLLSGGAEPENSFLIGAGASGDDVFMLTRGHFVTDDRNDNVDVYDARVNGFEPLAEPVCSGTGCQGVPPAPPIFATPASVTFEGVGNFPPPAKVAVKSKKKPKRIKQCRKGHVKKKGRCVKSSGAKANGRGRGGK